MAGSILLALFLLDVRFLAAQEMNCTVSINDRQISGSSFEYVSELQPALENYINENRWTDDRFDQNERIICNIRILLTDADSNNNFTAEAVFSLRRPIYDTVRQTTSIVISDSNWRFHYPRNKNLIFDRLQFDDLTSFIDFYIYILLGYDYDTFSELGGDSYYQQARGVLELAQDAGAAGWGRTIGSQRNRFGLVNDLTNPSYRDFRSAIYRYHRHGLDRYTQQPGEARSEIVDALDQVREAKRVTGNNYLFDLFFSTKYTEIVAALQDGEPALRTRAYNILRDADPANSSEYGKLMD